MSHGLDEHLSAESPRDWVRARVDSEQYAGASDYVRELIRRDQASAEERGRWLDKLDASPDQAFADAGRVIEAAEVFDRLKAKYAAMIRARRDLKYNLIN